MDTHGSGQAQFHSCAHCGDVVCVTATINNALYGALNARLLVYPQDRPQDRPKGMPEPVSMDYSEDDAAAKADRWAANWCSPVRIETGE